MKTMIESLHLEGFRQFPKLDVRFNEGFNFLSGPNGCGKTSVLAGVSHCFATSLTYSRFQENAEFWVDMSVDTQRYRVGTGAGAGISTQYRSSSLKRWTSPPSALGRTLISNYQATEIIGSNVPLFIGAQRSIKYEQIQGLRREESLQASISSYSNRTTQSLYGEYTPNIKQWFINRYFVIDKGWAGEERENWNHLIEQLPYIAPFDSKFSYVKTERDLEPIFRIYGKECYLEEISSGFQAILLIICTIFQWIEETREPGKRLAKIAEGTVLIDELDLHLHPEWQFTIRDGLLRIFPNLQFIVTTHSPHLLASAGNNEVIIMPARTDPNEPTLLVPTSRTYSGWNTDQILSDVMGVKSLDNKIYERLVSAALQSIREKNLKKLREAMVELQDVCHPDDSILVVLTAELAALEVRNDD
jgi:hypothetical protein